MSLFRIFLSLLSLLITREKRFLCDPGVGPLWRLVRWIAARKDERTKEAALARAVRGCIFVEKKQDSYGARSTNAKFALLQSRRRTKTKNKRRRQQVQKNRAAVVLWDRDRIDFFISKNKKAMAAPKSPSDQWRHFVGICALFFGQRNQTALSPSALSADGFCVSFLAAPFVLLVGN